MFTTVKHSTYLGRTLEYRTPLSKISVMGAYSPTLNCYVGYVLLPCYNGFPSKYFSFIIQAILVQSLILYNLLDADVHPYL